MMRRILCLAALVLGSFLLSGCGGGAISSTVASPASSPVIQNLTASGLPVAPGGSVTAQVTATSPAGLALSFAWSGNNGWTLTGGGNTSSATFTAPANFAASGSATVRVTDSNGNSATGTLALMTSNGPAAGGNVVASVEMAQTSANTYLLGDMNSGFVFYGNKKGTFAVTAYDANHVAITGPGAPTISVTATSGVSLTPPTAGAPNVWTAQNVVFDSFEFITLTATPLIGPPVTAHVPFITHHVSVYAVTQSGVPKVYTFYDDNTAPVQTTTLATVPAGLIVLPDGTEVVPLSNSTAPVFPAGASTPAYSFTAGLSSPSKGCIDHQLNIYMTNGAGAGDTLRFQPGADAVMTDYTAQQNLPAGCVVDLDNSLWVVNSGDSTLTHYPANSSTPDQHFALTGSSLVAHGVAVDRAGNLYVGYVDSSSHSAIQVYPRGSHTAAFEIPIAQTGVAPAGFAIDVGGGLWVANFPYSIQYYPPPVTAATVPATINTGAPGGILDQIVDLRVLPGGPW